MKCEECIKQGKKYRAYIGMSVINATYHPKYYDEDGKLTSSGSAGSSTSYSCSNGHEWTVKT